MHTAIAASTGAGKNSDLVYKHGKVDYPEISGTDKEKGKEGTVSGEW
ncbi:MAG: hypothetical protein ACAI34_21225 [Verrucomicrobium sp.]